ncbi:hypothetical protein Y032_0139g2133 [Ancylostoma ceylanicum]|uniref:Peptidase M13 N-terminal domain-containing protein n=1 Tax=Ancylostoma ceylanicum TaxID=53326 RepID=A0A016T3V1_9BILA|nr:hypothetical protein Y032_0139g2133 [Ancylostoma ceylanicum]
MHTVDGSISPPANQAVHPFGDKDDDVCFRTTLFRFHETIIANYESRTNGTMAMQKTKELEESIREEFRATIRSNSWLSEHMKKALILKANMMRLRSGYESIHGKEEEMEAFYKDLDRKEGLEKMTFLMMEDIFLRIAKNEEFEYLNDPRKMGDDAYETEGRKNSYGPFYYREFNMIGMLFEGFMIST